ncbi:glycoside hydrolase [Mycena belliarum]|uniref:alpha-1,2-Mannosidase n=1 Tax=Mycena belliarum TaxID=1033014 RepID=A0AAD6U6H7_9AGAR|nr:glycoside hydrolase [Mycena belliae]
MIAGHIKVGHKPALDVSLLHSPLSLMRRRTVQYLVALSVLAFVVHIYFNRSAREWLSHFSPLEGGPRGHRPYPPPRQKDSPSLPADAPKRDSIIEAFKHAWGAYERDAMGYDEYHPISHRGSNLGAGGGIGYTVVDAIDTMLLMGLDGEYTRARAWVQDSLSFNRTGLFSTFETTIRVLGGLLSAYHLSGDEIYLRHASDLGERMLPAFDSAAGPGLPAPFMSLSGPQGQARSHISLAEAGTLQLEFRYLAQLTGHAPFWHKAERVIQIINQARLHNGLVPVEMDVHTGKFLRSPIGMGSNGDSYYEYLLKQYLQTNRTEPVYLQMYSDAMQGVHDLVVQRTPTHNLTYMAELHPGGRGDEWATSWLVGSKQEHLACFLAGSLMLGATTVHLEPGVARASVPPNMEELTVTGQRDWQTGVDFLEGCMATHNTKTGLAPDGVFFRRPGESQADPLDDGRDWYIRNANPAFPPYEARYMLRPEISESVFLAWRLTGDERYRRYAWAIFSAIESHCRLPEGDGYATVLDVDTLPVKHEDKQETFFLSETLKYLFLTFADGGVLNLRDIVFNTEAHPLPVFRPSITPLFTKYS